MANAQVLNVLWTSIVAFSNDAATDDNPFSFCGANDLSRSGPPVPFCRESGVAHSEARMARFRVTESTRIVDFENSAILDGCADECMFEMKWESWQGEG